MAAMMTRDSGLKPVLLAVCRWLETRKGCLFLGMSFLFVLMTWISMNMSDVIVNTSYPGLDYRYKYMSDSRLLAAKKPDPQDIERKKRVAVFSRIMQKQTKRHRKESNQTQCIHPKLDLKHDTNRFAFFDMPPLNCNGNGFFSQNGMLALDVSHIPEPDLLERCSFYQIERYGDAMHTYKKPVLVDSPPFAAKIEGDFVRIQCVLKSTLEENKRLAEEEKSKVNYEVYNEIEYMDDKEEVEGNNLGNDKNVQDANGSVEGKDIDEGEGNNDEGQNLSLGSRGDPFDNNYGERPNTDRYRNFDYIDVNPDFEESDFAQFLVQVHAKPGVFRRIAKIKAASKKDHPMKLNVLMFALDSMSHLSYERKLPKTYKYLKDELSATILENYNIVGDATTAAIIPMLTGMTEADLPDVRAMQYGYDLKYVDEYPLVWKEFKKQGYATLYAEDEPSLGTFNLRLNGFSQPPTDHYMRPFWQALWESGLQRNSERFCCGDIAHHHFMLHYLEDFFIKYSNVSKFAFGFHGELTHADNNPAQYIDAELSSFLQRLKQSKFLDDTVLIIFGDHGARYSKVRRTVQGKLEERLPMMSFVFPPKFRQQYPHLYQNLQTNTERLTTPFDIHETLLDILNLTEANDLGVTSRTAPGISLLKEIPADRTCADAGIDMHWCSCLHRINVEITEAFVKPVVAELIHYLNAQTYSHRTKCAELSLKKVLNVQIVMPNQQVLTFLRSIDEDQRVANFSRDVDPDVAHYQVQVEMLPCDAVYEATVMADFRNHSNYQYAVTPGISRIDMYGSQPKCVQERFPLLRKFCCCKDYLEKLRKLQ